jgi:hypothetical protein
MTTLIIGSTFATTFSSQLNVGWHIHIVNFSVSFWNKFEKVDWRFVLRIGATIVI